MYRAVAAFSDRIQGDGTEAVDRHFQHSVGPPARLGRQQRLALVVRLKAGGKTRYLLSGLLRCDVCGSHYVIGDARAYACGGFVNGKACANEIRVRRVHAEEVLLAPIRDDLLAPARVRLMAVEMDAYYREQLRVRAERSTEVPKALTALEARIARLRERLHRGDPDMPADELQAAIERAEAKRRDLVESLPDADHCGPESS